MSITSSTTASRDQEVPSPDSFQNRLLLLTITKGDGTPMDASSISEEDIMEICIWRAHTHPLGVLQYSVVESVILFRSLEDVNHAHCTLLDVTELHDEAIMVQTMALAEAHVAAFTTMWHSNPTTGDGEPHTPPYQTPPSEETPCCLHAQLGDLNDSELWQLVKDLMQEIAQYELTVPPSNSLLMTGHVCWAVESLRKMTGRSPFQEGEGGVQRGKPPQYHIHQPGEEFPLDHCSNHPVLHWQDQIWGNLSLPWLQVCKLVLQK